MPILTLPSGVDVKLSLVSSVSPIYDGRYTIYMGGNHETIQDSELSRNDFIALWDAV